MADWCAYEESVLEKAGAHFKKNGNVKLLKFLAHQRLKGLARREWKRVYDPLRWSYRVAPPPEFVNGLPDCLRPVVGKRELALAECRKFRKGDYTLLFDGLKKGKGVAFFLDVNTVDELWGGYTSFVKGHEEVVRVVPQKNALFLVNQDGLKDFTKYVNHHAKRPRVFVYGVLQ